MYTISKLHDMLRNKQISAKEITQEYINKIEQKDEKIGAFLTITKEYALEQAKDADKLIESGEISPLTGIPCAIKDNICTKNIKIIMSKYSVLLGHHEMLSHL